jgi:DNA-binding transcriptional regulator LsrR (DeoR family)
MIPNSSQGFGERLRTLRMNASMTQEQLGARLDIDGKTVSNWERGKTAPSLIQLRALCRALDCSADELLGLVQPSRTQVEIAGGLKWRVVLPHNARGDREIEDSVHLFELMVKERKGFLDIQGIRQFAGYSLEQLRLLIRKALVAGIIEFVDVASDPKLEEELLKAYGSRLRRCFVANTEYEIDPLLDTTVRTEAVAFLAAREAVKYLPDNGTAGVTGGSTISRFVDLLPPGSPALRGLSWVPLLVAKEHDTRTGLSANSVITRLLYKQPGATAHRLSFVDAPRRERNYLMNATGYERSVLERSQWVLRFAQKVNVAFVSVGTPEYDYQTTDAHLGLPDLADILHTMPEEQRQACVGDILLRLVDGDGHRLGSEADQVANEAMVYSIGLDDLRRIATYGTVWALSARSSKAAVLRAALLSNTINSLVIDASVAKEMLRLQSGTP